MMSRRNHWNLQAGAVNRLHGGGKISLHPFGQNVTFGTNRNVNAIEPDVSRDGGRIADTGPL